LCLPKYVKVILEEEGKMAKHSGSGALYGLGVIGALVYYLQHATTFLAGLIGIVKAIF
jgi:hypothetical protein